VSLQKPGLDELQRTSARGSPNVGRARPSTAGKEAGSDLAKQGLTRKRPWVINRSRAQLTPLELRAQGACPEMASRPASHVVRSSRGRRHQPDRPETKNGI